MMLCSKGNKCNNIFKVGKARIFLLVDLREKIFRFRVGGTKKKKKSSENDQSIIKNLKKDIFFLNFFFQIFREQTVKQ